MPEELDPPAAGDRVDVWEHLELRDLLRASRDPAYRASLTDPTNPIHAPRRAA